jgi:hypothetical protein
MATKIGISQDCWISIGTPTHSHPARRQIDTTSHSKDCRTPRRLNDAAHREVEIHADRARRTAPKCTEFQNNVKGLRNSPLMSSETSAAAKWVITWSSSNYESIVHADVYQATKTIPSQHKALIGAANMLGFRSNG